MDTGPRREASEPGGRGANVEARRRGGRPVRVRALVRPGDPHGAFDTWCTSVAVAPGSRQTCRLVGGTACDQAELNRLVILTDTKAGDRPDIDGLGEGSGRIPSERRVHRVPPTALPAPLVAASRAAPPPI